MTDIQPTQNRSFIGRIFMSPDGPRLRAGWRLLTQIVLYIFLLNIIAIPVIIIGAPVGSLGILTEILDFTAITASIYIARRCLDKRSFERLGLKLNQRTLIDIFTGIGIAFV